MPSASVKVGELVSLTATDAAGNAATAKQAITVTATPPASGGSGGGTTDPGGAPDALSLDLDAPRKARARAKSIPVELTASDAGRVQLSLARGNRVIARAGVRLDADGTADYRLKLPKGTKAGRYTLKATYRTVTASRKLTLTGTTTARASFRSGVAAGRGPRALPDGRFHGDRPARTFKVRRAGRPSSSA